MPDLDPTLEYCATISSFGFNDQAVLPVRSNAVCSTVEQVTVPGAGEPPDGGLDARVDADATSEVDTAVDADATVAVDAKGAPGASGGCAVGGGTGGGGAALLLLLSVLVHRRRFRCP
jgi:MYXO-CTERM domain-containing protein